MIHVHSHNSILTYLECSKITTIVTPFSDQDYLVYPTIRDHSLMWSIPTIFSFKMWNRKRRNPKYLSWVISKKTEKSQSIIAAQHMLVLENTFRNYFIYMNWTRASFSSEQGWLLAVWMSNRWTRELTNWQCWLCFLWMHPYVWRNPLVTLSYKVRFPTVGGIKGYLILSSLKRFNVQTE